MLWIFDLVYVPGVYIFSLISMHEHMYGNICSLTLAKDWKICQNYNVPLMQIRSLCLRLESQTPPKTEITNCFIHRIQLKAVKSVKVIWCLGCLSALSAQVIILASELQEIMVMREGRIIMYFQLKSVMRNNIF